MTPSRDYRSGEFVARVKRWPYPQLKGHRYVELQQDDMDNPKRYYNIIERENLPAAVREAIDEHTLIFWYVKVGEGRVQFVEPSKIGEWSMGDTPDTEKPPENNNSKPKKPAKFNVGDQATVLIEHSELILVEPDQYRPDGLDDKQWEEVKHLATEMINGRA